MPDRRTTIPTLSLVFGFGPMLPFVAAALGVWLMADPWPQIAFQLALVWGALILAFVAGVRRGFGFERSGASTTVETWTMIPYVMLAGLGLLLPPAYGALALASGFAIAAVLDTRAAARGDAPAFFARLRPAQFPIAAVALVVVAASALR